MVGAVFAGFVLLFALVLFPGWMRTALLAGGNAVVRSGFDRCVLPGMVNGDWTIRSNSTWSKKKKSQI